MIRKDLSEPCCSAALQKNDAMSRRRFKYLSLFGHIDGTVLDMHHTTSLVVLPIYLKHLVAYI